MGEVRLILGNIPNEIIVALIGAAGLIIAALIGLLRPKNSDKSNKTVVTQKTKGNGITQIGIQNNRHGADKYDG